MLLVGVSFFMSFVAMPSLLPLDTRLELAHCPSVAVLTPSHFINCCLQCRGSPDSRRNDQATI